MWFTPEDFEIKPGYFDHESKIHGKLHTYRVMVHVLVLGNKLGFAKETRLAFFAAFIHDMSRKHDGFSLKHGPRAAKEKIPQLKALFDKYKLTEEEIKTIRSAVSNHSRYSEFRKDHPHYHVTALLKDADALDRIRMGEKNLNHKYIRYRETLEMIDFSHQLYYQSETMHDTTLKEILELAEDLSRINLEYCLINI